MRMISVGSFYRQTDYFWMVNAPYFQFTPHFHSMPYSYLSRRTENWDVGICLMAAVQNIFTVSKVTDAVSHLRPVTKNLNNVISVKDLKRAASVYLQFFNQSFSGLPFSDICTQFIVVLLLPIGGRRISCYDRWPADRNARSFWHPEDHQHAADCEDTSCVRSCVHYVVLRLPTAAHTHTHTHTHACTKQTSENTNTSFTHAV